MLHGIVNAIRDAIIAWIRLEAVYPASASYREIALPSVAGVGRMRERAASGR